MNSKSQTRKKLISSIWAISNSLGITEEYLYVIVFSLTNSSSISELNERQLSKIVLHLKEVQRKQNIHNKKLESGNKKVHRLPTPNQRMYCNQLLMEVKVILFINNEVAYLENISNRMFQKPSAKLSRHEYGNLIKQLIKITSAKNTHNKEKN
jgi:hypothetical protein